MPNPNTPFGLRPYSHRNGASYNGAFRTYAIPAADGTAVFKGDPVKLSATGGSTVGGVVYPDVIQAATGNVVVGVVVGFIPNPDNLTTLHRLASTLRLVMVADDPDLLFEIQEGTGGTPLAVADIGLNANFAVGAGNATSGLSGVTLNNATEATTNTLDLHIVNLSNIESNEIGDSAKWLVTLNNHQYANQIAGV